MDALSHRIDELVYYSLSRRGRWTVPLVWLSVIMMVRVGLWWVRQQHWLIMHKFWPLSVVQASTIRWEDILLVVAVYVGYGLTMDWWMRWRLDVKWLVIAMGGLIILTNLFNGWRWGIVHPMIGYGYNDADYWQDQATITNPLNYLQNYELIQPNLGYHARVHPPGPVLLLWGLRQLTSSHFAIMMVVFAGSVTGMMVAYKWLSKAVNSTIARDGVMLMGLLPATQIYLWWSIDGLISVVMLFTLWQYGLDESKRSLFKTIAGLGLAVMLTFGSLWLVGVMAVWAFYQPKLRHRLVMILIGVGGILLGIKVVSGYDYLNSLRLATGFEGFGGGFYALVEPFSYVATRIQDILEPIVFWGPYVTVCGLSILLNREQKQEVRLARFAAGVFGLFIIAGAYYTGETARAAYFITPVIMIAMVSSRIWQRLVADQKKWLFGSLLVQTIIMQIFGFWRW